MTTEVSAPWMAVGTPDAGFGMPEWMLVHASARRAETQARAAERREAEQRAERVEWRQNMAMMAARAVALAQGKPWSPDRPWQFWPSSEEMIAAAEAQQDLEARRAEFRAMREAGLVHVLNLTPDQAALEPAAEVQERLGHTELVRAQHRTYLEGLRAKARRALSAIRREAPRPAPAEQHREVTRSTLDCGCAGTGCSYYP